jgi:RHS repeat-associated protein
MSFANKLVTRAAFLTSFALVSFVSPSAASWCGNPVPPCEPSNPNSKCYQPPPPDPRCEPRECKKCTKSPCYVGSGVYVNSAVDLELPTPGFTLSASRNYESTHTIDGPMGHGWTSSLTAHLYYATYLLAAPNVVQREANITMPDGARYRFIEDGVGGFTPPLGRHDALVRNPDGSFDLTIQRTMSKLHFAADGALISMTDDYGNSLLLTYDGAGHLERIADQAGSGRYIDAYWGADGRISDLVDSAGREINFTYDAQGLLTSSADPLNRITHYSYSPGKYVPLLASVMDNWGRVGTTVNFDSKDRVAGYSANGESFSYVYNYQNNPARTAKIDSAGNAWIYVHSEGGLVTDETPPAGGPLSLRHTDYYPDGSIQQILDPLGVKTFFTYDSGGNLLTTTRDYQGPDAVRFDFQYDSNFPGRVAAITPTDPATGLVNSDWLAMRFDYYQAGNSAPGKLHHSFRVQANGLTLDTLATYAYDSHGRVTSIADAEGATTTYSYDAKGDLALISRPTNSDAGTRLETAYVSDSLGRVTRVTDPMGSMTNLTYDQIGRVLTAALPPTSEESLLDFTASFGYDTFDGATGLVFSSVTDPNGNTVTHGYDVFSRLRQSTDALGAITANSYTHDLLTGAVDANGNATTYVYDKMKRATSIVHPDLTQQSYTYYADGLLKSKTDRNGQTTTYAYDHLKRLSTRTLPNLSTIDYSFVGLRLREVNNAATSPQETHLYSYDDSYRLESQTQGSQGTISYSYTPTDRLADYSVSGGASAAYSYYPDGSLNTISWNRVAGVFKYTYNARGQYDEVIFPNGQHRDYSYDQQGRLLQISNLHPIAGNLATYAYQYDLDNASGEPATLGQRTGMTADVPSQGFSGALTSYFYDAKYQLVGVNYPTALPFIGETESWTYDFIGNRVSSSVGEQTQTYVYGKFGTNPNNSSRLLEAGVSVYSYDSNGSVTAQSSPAGSYTFGWTSDNQLSSIVGTGAAGYTYDYRGRRTKTIAAGGGDFLYQGLNLIAKEGLEDSEFVYGPGMDEPLAMSHSGGASYFTIDGLGSITLVSNASGTVQNSYVFDSWGVTRSKTETVPNPFGYTGREFGEGSDWQYRARIYRPTLGRFLSEDPALLAGLAPYRGGRLSGGATNQYGYVLNNPTNSTDPKGLTPEGPPPNSPLPPNWCPDWDWRLPEGERPFSEEPRWFDPEGGEWKYHPADHNHPDPHWDHWKWDQWNDPHVRIPADPNAPRYVPEPKPVPWWNWIPRPGPTPPLIIPINPCLLAPETCIDYGTGGGVDA